MTEKIKGFTVILDHDVREDDFDAYRSILLMIKGVDTVIPSMVSADDEINRMRIKRELAQKLNKVLE